MSATPLRVAIVGAGNIAGPYAAELVAEPLVDLLGVTDLEPDRAAALAREVGVAIYPSLDAVLDDPRVDLVVNLTPHRAHAGITMRALRAGKHAYSEKPLAIDSADARALVAEAERRGLRLACAPSSFMGEAQQTAWKALRDGAIGTVRLVYAEVNWGRIEAWHPAPEAFYDIGVMIDVGIYPLALLTTLFGRVDRVQAYGTILFPHRVTKVGRPFEVGAPEMVVAVLRFAGGQLLRLTTNWYVEGKNTVQHGVEFHGDTGSLLLSSWLTGDATVRQAPLGGEFEDTPLARIPERGIVWSRAVPEMARAITERRPHRAAGDHAAHLVDVMNAIAESIARGTAVEVTSDFRHPEPMEWAR